MSFKILSGPLVLYFGSPTIILAQSQRGNTVHQEWYLMVRPHWKMLSKYLHDHFKVDTRPNENDIERKYQIDLEHESTRNEYNAKRAFIDYGMNLPFSLELMPEEPEVTYSEQKKEFLLQMLKNNIGRTELHDIKDRTTCTELKKYLGEILALELATFPPYEAYNSLDSPPDA